MNFENSYLSSGAAESSEDDDDDSPPFQMCEKMQLQLRTPDPFHSAGQKYAEFSRQQQRARNTDIFLYDADGGVTGWHKSLVIPRSTLLAGINQSLTCACNGSSFAPDLHLSLENTSNRAVMGLTSILYTGTAGLKSREELDGVRKLAKRLKIEFGESGLIGSMKRRYALYEQHDVRVKRRKREHSPNFVGYEPIEVTDVLQIEEDDEPVDLVTEDEDERQEDEEDVAGISVRVITEEGADEEHQNTEEKADEEHKGQQQGVVVAKEKQKKKTKKNKDSPGWCCQSLGHGHLAPCENASEQEKNHFAMIRQQHLACKYAQCTFCGLKYKEFSRFREHLCSHYGAEMLSQLNVRFKNPKVELACPSRGCEFRGNKSFLAVHLGLTHNLLTVYASNYEKEEFKKLHKLM